MIYWHYYIEYKLKKMAETLENQALHLLGQVVNEEAGENIVAMGMVKNVSVSEGKIDCIIEFKGASSDVVALHLAGTGHYDGSAGAIKAAATNTTATSSDIKGTTNISQTSKLASNLKNTSFI